MIENIITNNFNRKIFTERRRWGMTRKNLAKKTYIDEEIIKEIEYGIYDNLNLNIVTNLSITLQIPFFDLLNNDLTVKALRQIMKKENLFV